MKSRLLVFAAAVMLTFGAAQAALIDFEADVAGSKLNGYSPVGHPGVTLTDTSGADLQINVFCCNQGDGKSLGIFGDDASRLVINFGALQTFVSLDFGNDDPSRAPVFALLELFNGATSVGSTQLAADNDDTMNQTIALGAIGGFDSARFTYVDAAGIPLNLIELVDNINYTTRINAVPEPGMLALIGLGLFGLRFSRRKA